MQHVYGIEIGNSLTFSEQITRIADAISKKKLARHYFGNAPFVTPEKNVFVLRKNNENQMVLALSSAPEPRINLTLAHSYINKSDFDNITGLAKEITELICNRLEVEVIRIGSVFEDTKKAENKFELFYNKFAKNLFSDEYNSFGGYVKHIYTTFPNEIGKEININLEINVHPVEDLIATKFDINNKDIFIGMSPDDINKIGTYSLLLYERDVKKLLGNEGN